MPTTFIIGFPKSGNTWLVRMIARALNIHAEAFPTPDRTRDPAADVNVEIDTNDDDRVVKLHYTPKDFTDVYGSPDEGRFIYLKRNPLDVMVSGFFYFCYRGEERFALANPEVRFLMNPRYLLKHLHARRKFNDWVKVFCKQGISVYGTWPAHVRRWEEFFDSHPNLCVAYTTYEDLRENTVGELDRILTSITGVKSTAERIKAAVSAEEFLKRKKCIEESAGEITYGKEYNLKFLRSGMVGDYARFATKRQCDKLRSMFSESDSDHG
jgi:hypothetical protein